MWKSGAALRKCGVAADGRGQRFCQARRRRLLVRIDGQGDQPLPVMAVLEQCRFWSYGNASMLR
jgi:hypothetical protein